MNFEFSHMFTKLLIWSENLLWKSGYFLGIVIANKTKLWQLLISILAVHFWNCCYKESFESQTRGVSNLLDFKLPGLNTHIYVHDTKSCFQIENRIINSFNIFISNTKYVLHKLRKAWFISILIKVNLKQLNITTNQIIVAFKI